MTNIVDMTSVIEGDTSSLDTVGIKTTHESTQIEAKELPEGTMMELKKPGTDNKYTFPAMSLAGGDYNQIIKASDNTIPEKDIRRYYDICMNT